MFRQATRQETAQMDALTTKGVERTWITEMVSMASTPADPVPLLVSLKAVDPAKYPFYGKVQLDPAGSLPQMLTDSTVIVGEDLLIRLRVKVGDLLSIGGRKFRIAAVLVKEPDRITATMGLGPRVLMTRSAIEKTSLLQPGSRSGERYLFRIDPTKNGVGDVRGELEKILPDAQVTDFRETSPALSQGLDRSTGLLSLICLVAMVLGAIGVAMAMRAHLQQRIDIIAIMKSIGARSSDILRIYLFQTLLLGVAGALIGIALGVGVEWILPALFGKLLPISPPLRLPIKSVAAGLGTGVLTTILFCLPPLLDIRRIRPNLVLRRMVEEGEGGGPGLWTRLKRSNAQIVTIVVIVAGLGGIAAALTDSMVVGRWFAGSLCALLAVILGLSSVTLRVLRAFLARTRLHLPSALRHGLANLYRPGNQSASVLAALGAGVMLILSVYLMQNAIVHEMRLGAAPTIPNVFLVDIGSDELSGVLGLLSHQAGVRGNAETLPVVSGRLESVDGTPLDRVKVTHYPKRFLQSISLTWSDSLPEGDKLVSGQWWRKNDEKSVAVSDHLMQRMNLHLGSNLVFTAGEQSIAVKVAASFKNDGQHIYGRSEFILPSRVLKDQPVVWYGAVHVDPQKVGDMQRALFAAYPTVTVINIADVLETIQGVIGQITLVVRFLAGFSMLAGGVILASSVASTRFRRIREVVVLKTLGATRNRIATVFSVEFLVLGLLAGGVGVVFANLLSRVLLHRLDVHFHVDWIAAGVSVGGTALLAIATGWIASFHILGQKPLEVLREE
jgi:putative ABC transport system permease protein